MGAQEERVTIVGQLRGEVDRANFNQMAQEWERLNRLAASFQEKVSRNKGIFEPQDIKDLQQISGLMRNLQQSMGDVRPKKAEFIGLYEKLRQGGASESEMAGRFGQGVSATPDEQRKASILALDAATKATRLEGLEEKGESLLQSLVEAAYEFQNAAKATSEAAGKLSGKGGDASGGDTKPGGRAAGAAAEEKASQSIKKSLLAAMATAGMGYAKDSATGQMDQRLLRLDRYLAMLGSRKSEAPEIEGEDKGGGLTEAVMSNPKGGLAKKVLRIAAIAGAAYVKSAISSWREYELASSGIAGRYGDNVWDSNLARDSIYKAGAGLGQSQMQTLNISKILASGGLGLSYAGQSDPGLIRSSILMGRGYGVEPERMASYLAGMGRIVEGDKRAPAWATSGVIGGLRPGSEMRLRVEELLDALAGATGELTKRYGNVSFGQGSIGNNLFGMMQQMQSLGPGGQGQAGLGNLGAISQVMESGPGQMLLMEALRGKVSNPVELFDRLKAGAFDPRNIGAFRGQLTELTGGNKLVSDLLLQQMGGGLNRTQRDIFWGLNPDASAQGQDPTKNKALEAFVTAQAGVRIGEAESQFKATKLEQGQILGEKTYLPVLGEMTASLSNMTSTIDLGSRAIEGAVGLFGSALRGATTLVDAFSSAVNKATGGESTYATANSR